MTEQEQVQQLKNWLKQYGLTIIAGIVIAFSASTAWHYWQTYREKTLSHASSVYDEMLNLRAQGNSVDALVQADKLMAHYRNTPYAQMATLLVARDAVLKKNYSEAHKQLNWVIQHGSDASMKEIARLRNARLYIEEKNPQQAIDLLNKIDDKNFIGLIDETKGDAYVSMNNTQAAHQAYQAALHELPNAEINRPLLRMKLDNLAT